MFINRGWVLYLSERSIENEIGFHVEAYLSDEDVERYRSVIEGAIAQFGSVRLLFAFDDMDDATPQDIWEKLKFSVAYRKDVERLALVGDESVENWAADLFDPISRPEVRYFTSREYDEAWEWLKEE
jgi:hypothetical protein